MRGRLGEVLLRCEARIRQHAVFRDADQVFVGFLLVLVVVDKAVAREDRVLRGGFEDGIAGGGRQLHGVVGVIRHAAGREAVPDQLVQAQFVAAHLVLDLLRRTLDGGRADGFVRILDPLVFPGGGRGLAHIILAVFILQVRPGGGIRFRADARAVGSEVGNQTYGTLRQLHAFIQGLRHAHGLGGRKAQDAGGLLLQRAGGEGVGGLHVLARAGQGLDFERAAVQVRDHVLGVRFRFQGAGLVVVLQDERRLAAFDGQGGLQGPVLLGIERVDLPVAAHHHVQGGGLHAARGQTPLDLLPQQRAHGIPGHAVQHAARLLRVHEFQIDGAGAGQRGLHRLLCDLIETDAVQLRIDVLQQERQMPRDGFALAVRVRRQIDLRGLLRLVLQGLDHVALASDGDVLRLVIVLNIHAHPALRQIPQVSARRLHAVIRPQEALDGVLFRGRFYYY